MKAVQYAEFGGPEVLRVVDVDPPHAGPGQIRITVHAAGVNGIDWKLRSGAFPDHALPSGTGLDAAGIVDEVGDGVASVRAGDPVFGAGQATWAEKAVLTHWTAKPDTLPFTEAAGYPIPAETAIRVLREVGIEPGSTLLVSGAAGGVGSAVVQIARHRGITVIGTASPGNQTYLRSLGAIPTTYGPGLPDRVRSLAPHGIDAALDIAGSGVIPDLIALTGDPTTVLSIADFTAPQHGAQVSFKPHDQDAAYAAAARLHTEGAFHLPVERTFPLTQAAEAQAASQAGHVTGRLIITPA